MELYIYLILYAGQCLKCGRLKVSLGPSVFLFYLFCFVSLGGVVCFVFWVFFPEKEIINFL